jgi:hypothetical protein
MFTGNIIGVNALAFGSELSVSNAARAKFGLNSIRLVGKWRPRNDRVWKNFNDSRIIKLTHRVLTCVCAVCIISFNLCMCCLHY